MRQCQMTLDFLKELKKEVKWHGRGKNEAAHYCTNCEVRNLYIRIDCGFYEFNFICELLAHK